MRFLTTRMAVGCAFAALTLASAAAETNFAARAERTYLAHQRQAQQEKTNAMVLVHFARAAFDWAEFSRSDDQREAIALAGIDAARRALAQASNNAAAHYWLAMNLGQLARTKTLGALKLVREMESEFLTAITMDARVEYAGPERSLGNLYREAPDWPTSIGNKRKAREHFERAVQLHPEFPENQLGLLESFEQWEDLKDFALQFPKTEQAITEARQKFTGETWEASWADWNQRWAGLKSRSGTADRTIPSQGAK